MNQKKQVPECQDKTEVMNANAKATLLTEKLEDEVTVTLQQLGAILNALVHNAFHTSDDMEKDGNFHSLISIAEHLQEEATRQTDEALEMAHDLEQLNKDRSQMPASAAAAIDRLVLHDWEVMHFVMDAPGSMTVKEAAQAGLARFGAERAPSETTLETFYLAANQYKGDRVMGRAGAMNGGDQPSFLRRFRGVREGFRDKEAAKTNARARGQFLKGLKQQEAVSHFEKCYEDLSKSGSCDGPGGGEYSRVLEEWLKAGMPEPSAFILHRANIGSDQPAH